MSITLRVRIVLQMNLSMMQWFVQEMLNTNIAVNTETSEEVWIHNAGFDEELVLNCYWYWYHGWFDVYS